MKIRDRSSSIREVLKGFALIGFFYALSVYTSYLPGANFQLIGWYSLGHVYWLFWYIEIAIVLFAMRDDLSLLGSSYLNFEASRTVVTVVSIVIIWVIMYQPLTALAWATNAGWMIMLMNAAFLLSLAYCLALGIVRMRLGKRTVAKPSSITPHWAGREIGERYAVYLARLEELKASGKIDENTYQRLKGEYESKLREAIEVPIQRAQASVSEDDKRYMKACKSCGTWIPLASEICHVCKAKQ